MSNITSSDYAVNSQNIQPSTVTGRGVETTIFTSSATTTSPTTGVQSSIVSVDVQVSSVTGQASSVNVQASSVTGQATSVNGQASSVTGQASSVNVQASSVTGQATSVNGQASSVTGQASSVNVQASSVTGQASSVNVQASSVTGQASSVNEQVISVNEQTLSVNGQTTGVHAVTTAVQSTTTVNGQATNIIAKATPTVQIGQVTPTVQIGQVSSTVQIGQVTPTVQIGQVTPTVQSRQVTPTVQNGQVTEQTSQSVSANRLSGQIIVPPAKSLGGSSVNLQPISNNETSLLTLTEHSSTIIGSPDPSITPTTVIVSGSDIKTKFKLDQTSIEGVTPTTVSGSDIKTKFKLDQTSIEGVTSNIVMKSANIFTQNLDMTQYLSEASILFTSSSSQYDLNNDFTSQTTYSSYTQDFISDLEFISPTSTFYHGAVTSVENNLGSSQIKQSGSTVDYSKSGINNYKGSTTQLEDYVSMTTIQNEVISLNSKMDYPDSIISPTPNLSSHYPPSHPRMILTHPPPSASQVSQIVPSVAGVMLESRSVGLTDVYPGSTVVPSGGFTTNPGTNSSTPGATTLPINFMALYIAIPVCFIIIMIAVGLSYIGFSKRKKKRWNSTNDRGNLWMNPVSDASIPINSVSTGSTDNDHKITTNLLSKTPPTVRKDQPDDLHIYRVLYHFEAQLESQISLKPDEIVSVMEKAENGWFRGEVLGRSGWFPSSFVEEIEPPSVENLEKVEPDGSLKKKGTVTSFLLKKREKQRKRSRNLQIEENEDLEIEKEEGLVSEIINMNDIRGVSLDMDDITQSSGKLYKTVFQYKVSCKGEIPLNVGDVVVCYDRDRNGWMRGRNLNSNDEGWFPAVYVNEATEEERPKTPTPLTYDQLSSNKTRNSNTEAIGIEHKAVYSYNSGKPEDLMFETGDTIVVFETLDNGWWLGCHGDEVGWLPGSYLELLDKSDDSSSNASSSVKNFSIFDEMEQMSVKSNRSSVNILDDSLGNLPSEKDHEKSTKIIKRESKSVLSPDFKPARKAPLPPSVKPQTASPKISMTKPDQRSMDSLTDILSEKLKPGEKPELPVRFVKPKLVKVPKHSSKKLRHLAVQPRPSERPLPPRPQVSKSTSQSRYRKYKSKDQNNQLNVINGQNGESTPMSSTPVGQRKLPPKPPIRKDFDVESIDTKVDDLDLSMNSIEGSLNNSVGPKILNRISAHLLDEVGDNSMTPKIGGKTKRLKKVSPPVLPPPNPTNQNSVNNDMESPNEENKLLDSQNQESSELKLEEKDENEIPKDFDLTGMESEFVTTGDMHIDMGKYLDCDQEETKSETDKETDNLDVFPPESENILNVNESDDSNTNIKDKTTPAQTHVETNQSKLLNELNKFVNNNSTDKSENVQNELKLKIPKSNGIEKDNISNSSENSNHVRKFPKPKVAPKPLSPKPHVSKSLVSQPLNNITNTTEDLSATKRTSLRIALRSFQALQEGELSFDEGSFIMDIEEESARPGWCVGMLADGTTGLYPLSHVGTSRSELQTEL